MTEIWVDFNSISAGQVVTTLRKYASDPDAIVAGLRVTASDEDGNSCPGAVISVGDGGLVVLALDLSRFVAGVS